MISPVESHTAILGPISVLDTLESKTCRLGNSAAGQSLGRLSDLSCTAICEAESERGGIALRLHGSMARTLVLHCSGPGKVVFLFLEGRTAGHPQGGLAPRGKSLHDRLFRNLTLPVGIKAGFVDMRRSVLCSLVGQMGLIFCVKCSARHKRNGGKFLMGGQKGVCTTEPAIYK